MMGKEEEEESGKNGIADRRYDHKYVRISICRFVHWYVPYVGVKMSFLGGRNTTYKFSGGMYADNVLSGAHCGCGNNRSRAVVFFTTEL